MRTFDPRSEKTTDKTDGSDDIPTDSVLLGADGQGVIHLFSRDTNTISVIDTDDRIERIDLRFYSLIAWVTITAQERGWRNLREAEMFVEILAENSELQ